MSQAPHLFKQRDLSRVFRAAKAAGFVSEVRITRDGEMIISPVTGATPAAEAATVAKDAADVVAKRLK